MPEELYHVLGIGSGASQKEIREAYRALAKKHHPDLNPGDTGSEETFKKVQAAYDILSDSEKRRQYDAGEIDAEGRETTRQFYREYADAGANERSYHSSAGFEDLGNIFSDLFRTRRPGEGGAGEGAHVRMRGGDMRYSMEVPFLDAALGTTTRLTLPGGQRLDVVIPAGHRDGQVLRLKGKGMPGPGGGQAGDAYIEVSVQPHETFASRDRDILIELPVALHEAVLGARIEVPTIHGPVMMTIPPGSNTGDTLRLKGKGLAAARKGRAGDQLITLRVELPKKPDADLKAFMKEWAKDHAYDPRQGRGG